jgi:hypothetical protein
MPWRGAKAKGALEEDKKGKNGDGGLEGKLGQEKGQKGKLEGGDRGARRPPRSGKEGLKLRNSYMDGIKFAKKTH